MKMNDLKKLGLSLTQKKNGWKIMDMNEVIGWGVNYSQAYKIMEGIAERMINDIIKEEGIEVPSEMNYSEILSEII